MPAYNKRAYSKPTRVTLRGVVKRPYRSSGGYGGGTPMSIVTTGISPLRTGGFFGPRRTTQEKKTIDVDPAAYVSDTTGTITLLNGVAVGTDFTDRIGRKILMKSIFIRGIHLPVDDSTGNFISRLVIVYDRQANGVAPAITDVVKSINGSAQINLNNRDRFQILFDKQYVTAKVSDTATQSFAGSPTVHSVKLFRRLRHETVFQGTAATVASIATGSVYMLTFSNAAANTGGSFSLSTRIRFADA